MSLRIFVSYEDRRHSLDVKPNDDVGSLKLKATEVFQLDTRGGQFVVLNYHGSDLADDWYLSDIGVSAGATLKVSVREDVKPKLYVYSVFNGETIEILDDIHPLQTTVAELKTLIVRRSGLPVSVFRVVTEDGTDMFDLNSLDTYGIEFGSTVRMLTWDGWNEFLKAASIGHTSEVTKHLSADEHVAKFQCRVALFIAAHHGHMDLASTMLRQGVRSDEPIGDHPTREWCSSTHIESYKTPIHEAAEHGQLQILRIFVFHNICCVTCKDGNSLTPLSVALRKQQREVALYLLTKQWSSVTYSAVTLPLTIYSQVRRWCDRAKDRVMLIYGAEKSSLKIRRPYRQNGALCGQGVHIDGFTESRQNASPRSKSYNKIKCKALGLVKKSPHMQSLSVNSVHHASTVRSSVATGETSSLSPTSPENKLPRLNGETVPSLVAKYKQQVAEKRSKHSEWRPRSRSVTVSPTKFPSINQQHAKMKSSSHQNLTVSHDYDFDENGVETDFNASSAYYVNTPADGKRRRSHKAAKIPPLKLDKSPRESDERTKKMEERKKWRRHILVENTVPLPAMSLEATQKPFYYTGTRGVNLPVNTIKLYEDIIGCSAREKAIESLAIASTFKEKPWLQQVRLAMSFSRQHIMRIASLDTITPGRKVTESDMMSTRDEADDSSDDESVFIDSPATDQVIADVRSS
ncbi:protein ANKUB1-like [Saccoglossus kowalevskii]|uniref:Protein ANKUB1-like n=1 Tax=Saccoglossus kowalevskii TaxID=10224 RepID=A0ABM0GZJ7_SACKO|nr:PREDICTED: protein ANKUB1-like [Saccoglossus kowalevskii]